MTPSQIEGIGRAVAALLREAHEGGCEPSGHALEIRRWFARPNGAWLVEAYAIEPDGSAVVLSAIVDEGGNVERLDAHSPEPDPAGERTECAHPNDCDEIGNVCSYEDCPFGTGLAAETQTHPGDRVGDLRDAPTAEQELSRGLPLGDAQPLHGFIIANVSSQPDRDQPAGTGQTTAEHRPGPDTYADPLARPGVRINADGQPLYSSKWL